MAEDKPQPYNIFEIFVNNELKPSEENTRFLDGLEQVMAEEGAPFAQQPQAEVVIRAYFSNRMAYLILYQPERVAKAVPSSVLPLTARSLLPPVRVANRNLLEVAKECEIEMAYRGLSGTRELWMDPHKQKALLYKFSHPTPELKQKLADLISYLSATFEGQTR